jgi:hypothetical protein
MVKYWRLKVKTWLWFVGNAKKRLQIFLQSGIRPVLALHPDDVADNLSDSPDCQFSASRH